jgi:hypothetical protein
VLVIVLLAMLNLNVVLPVGHNFGATKDQESELLFGLSSTSYGHVLCLLQSCFLNVSEC